MSVLLDDEGSESPAEVENLSEGGALLRMEAPVQRGWPVRVVFEQGVESRAVCSGQVVRVDDDHGVGVEFEETAEPLRGFVRRLLDTCRELHREALDE